MSSRLFDLFGIDADLARWTVEGVELLSFLDEVERLLRNMLLVW